MRFGHPASLRDRAILLLLARLGLRAGNIVTLCLDDIDWQQATLSVDGKGGRETRLPLPQDSGDAVLDYLYRGRPRPVCDRLSRLVSLPDRLSIRFMDRLRDLAFPSLKRVPVSPVPCLPQYYEAATTARCVCPSTYVLRLRIRHALLFRVRMRAPDARQVGTSGLEHC
ncbi:tyrosine-type recombinase/integrase [Bradyrhizobium sp. CB3481]|uniref:tyrosine-type recombinase/integrase n=1 Tax=Bradyrhizobium sp. CB3481 TaxID=3039158 RepID=UPI0024B19239|nr:tyrosine-type recombinase/integrase [Bradyrhizobium sp. CB3481]WFU14576.1 tyrosine-type recombinase/integrase [Bradyrhizobium sp. CB3481]